ncbi:hypothetical protein MMC19_001786 [Ptychographa xylographoides]|nr:hypothetical protein [Ptychographa xylographoides]
MPGIRSIVWNDANDAKMLKALLYYGKVELTHEAASQIAAHMGKKRFQSDSSVYSKNIEPRPNILSLGPDVPAKAIFSHIQVSKGRFLKANGDKAPVNTKLDNTKPINSKRQPVVESTAAAKKAKTIVKEEAKEEQEDGNEVHAKNMATPPESPAGKTRAESPIFMQSKRTSPRGAKAVDYNKLNDPFVDMEGVETGADERIFEDEGASSEDLADSDAGFDGDADKVDEGDDENFEVV